MTKEPRTPYEVMLELMVTIACREAARWKRDHYVMKSPAAWWVRHAGFPNAPGYERICVCAPDDDPAEVVAQLRAGTRAEPAEDAPPSTPPEFHRAPADDAPKAAGPAKQAAFAWD